MVAEQKQNKFMEVSEMFLQAVDTAVVLKQKVLEGRSTDDGEYREAFYQFYNKFMSLYYVTKWDVTNGKTLDGLESVEKRQGLIDSIEQFDEDVMTGRIDKADATTGVKLFRQYIEYLKYYDLVQ
jgi:hypothetical protein